MNDKQTFWDKLQVCFPNKTQREISDLTGVSQTTISNFLNGWHPNKMTDANARKLARATNKPVIFWKDFKPSYDGKPTFAKRLAEQGFVSKDGGKTFTKGRYLIRQVKLLQLSEREEVLLIGDSDKILSKITKLN